MSAAAKGSATAQDILSFADMAYMVSLTGDPTSPETLQLTDYSETMCDYFTKIQRPESAIDLAETIDRQDWFEFKFRKHLVAPKVPQTYASLWARGQTVSTFNLLNDSIQICHSSWSADWLLRTIEEESDLSYNSLNVVAAMLMLAVTWKNDGEL